MFIIYILSFKPFNYFFETEQLNTMPSKQCLSLIRVVNHEWDEALISEWYISCHLDGNVCADSIYAVYPIYIYNL